MSPPQFRLHSEATQQQAGINRTQSALLRFRTGAPEFHVDTLRGYYMLLSLSKRPHGSCGYRYTGVADLGSEAKYLIGFKPSSETFATLSFTVPPRFAVPGVEDSSFDIKITPGTSITNEHVDAGLDMIVVLFKPEPVERVAAAAREGAWYSQWARRFAAGNQEEDGADTGGRRSPQEEDGADTGGRRSPRRCTIRTLPPSAACAVDSRWMETRRVYAPRELLVPGRAHVCAERAYCDAGQDGAAVVEVASKQERGLKKHDCFPPRSGRR
ncbi:hypothetical protein FN846DRAFT_986682 [Sphaerosporella brunnea]|uniref:Uncharacterized protein n=1 Tax=Sphaerosporella brunnea TaxID=1250544 RepID=A0A5J5F9P2_9PEZI|nr:hypothetical protein FN846DRAFT_986682 [Sphaerosporella brunnea]